MFLTTVTDITPMVTTTARGPLMLMLSPRLRLRLSMAITDTLTVWDTTLAMLVTDTLDTPTLPMVESPPPTLLWVTPWPTLPVESLTPPTSASAPTTSEPSSPARQSVSSTVSTSSFVKFIEILIKTKILQ